MTKKELIMRVTHSGKVADEEVLGCVRDPAREEKLRAAVEKILAERENEDLIEVCEIHQDEYAKRRARCPDAKEIELLDFFPSGAAASRHMGYKGANNPVADIKGKTQRGKGEDWNGEWTVCGVTFRKFRDH
jgi:hypothetical protein